MTYMLALITILFLFSLFACWGSFLNVVAYRITYDKPFFTKRSYCPMCGSLVRWYDNIPIISWLLLCGKCRDCQKPITYLYLLVETLSGLIFTALFVFLYSGFYNLYFVSRFLTYFVFFSALIVSTRTDLQAMVIPQLLTLWLIPIGVLSSFMGMSGIVVYESVLGAFLGYGVLWLIGYLYKRFAKREGLGVGDMELLSMIGSFLGIVGVWFTLFIGSFIGLAVSGSYLLLGGKSRLTRIPFGPFLALGATIYFFFKSFLFYVFF